MAETSELREVLVERFRVKEDVAKKIQIFPATSDSDKLLLNGERAMASSSPVCYYHPAAM